MKKFPVLLKSGCSLLTMALAGFFSASPPVCAQSTPAQATKSEQQRDSDINYGQLANFDNFLDKHRELAEQLRKNPSLVRDEDFVKSHPALQEYFRNNPDVREEIRENPELFMRAENRVDRLEGRGDRDRDNDRGDRRDITHGELQSFDNFLDRHREISEQLRKNPSLANNEQFLKDHPALRDYLQAHQGVREEIRENPDVFMHAENRFDRREDALNRRENDFDRDRGTGDMDRDTRERSHMHRDFGAFLNSHSELAEQLSKDPLQVKNDDFLKSHPELKEYLDSHPHDRQALMANPQAFIKNSQQFANGGNQTAKPPAEKPKPNQ